MAFSTRFTTTSSLTTANHYPSRVFKAEKEKAVGDDDLFVLYCTGRVPDILDALFHNCAVVDQSCWDEYFGPFVARFAFLAKYPAAVSEHLIRGETFFDLTGCVGHVGATRH
ncbi:hypothetical protein JG687_00001926 [Phytophthora cactorum]|uniref:Uncharacterized protein n=1 Tax=Phytophthora cactorum TaxID=29920 RepID=A0A8T1V0M4_9STRA|nr:hypothetical protein GQ600_14337 [Phytophthora cactorum]KAG6971604.1 hypothetical protein JG687_00001926 [Phytophthora cactorum]